MFQQLPPPAPVPRFYTTGSPCVGERTAPPDVGIVQRCEPAAVLLCRKILVQLVQEREGGLVVGAARKQQFEVTKGCIFNVS